jgi:hypothetical protein
MLKRAAIILLFAVPSGWLLGRAWSGPGRGVSVESVAAVAAAPAPPGARERPRERKLGKEEFIDSIRERSVAMSAPGFNAMSEVLADWTDAEIIAALQESITDPAAHGMPGEDGSATLFLLKEWMKRDLDSAMKWFGGLDSTLLKGKLAPTIAADWPQDRAEEGLAFLLANQGVFRSGNGADFVTKAFNSAIAKGPAAVNELLHIVRENDLDYFRVTPEFPPGFDFQALADAGGLTGTVEKNFENPVIMAWAQRDRDAAYRWTLENVGAEHVRSQLLGGTAAGSAPDVDWSAARFEEMDEDQRSAFMKSTGNFLGRDMRNLAHFSHAIQDPELRDELRLQGVQGIFSDRMPIAKSMLELLGPPERRLEILENLERQPITEPMFFTDTTVNEARLREMMGEWTTDQKRIDAIIDHLKQP